MSETLQNEMHACKTIHIIQQNLPAFPYIPFLSLNYLESGFLASKNDQGTVSIQNEIGGVHDTVRRLGGSVTQSGPFPKIWETPHLETPWFSFSRRWFAAGMNFGNQFRCVPPCVAKACAGRPVFARVVGELRSRRAKPCFSYPVFRGSSCIHCAALHGLTLARRKLHHFPHL